MRLGGELLLAEGRALALQGEALAGEVLFAGAVEVVEELFGGADLGIGAGEGLVGVDLGAVEGVGIAVAGLEGGEAGGELGVFLGVLREDEAAVVDAEGALAGDDAKLGEEELDDGDVGAVFTVEPGVQALALGGGETREAGVGAESAAGAQGWGGQGGARRHDCTLAGRGGGVRRVPGVCTVGE